MRSHLRACANLTILAVLAASVVGCQGAGWRAPWTPDPAIVSAEYSKLPIAAERIDKTRALAKQARKGTAEAKNSLFQQIQQESDPLVRIEILKAAAKLDEDATAEAVLGAGLRDEAESVREVACRIWGERGGPQAVARLAAVARSDESLDVQLAAVRALGETRDPTAAEAIAPALSHRDPAMQYRAVTSLRKVSEEDLGRDVNAWRRKFDPSAVDASEAVETSIASSRGGFRLPNPFRR